MISTGQVDLFPYPKLRVPLTAKQKFDRFHAQNPQVYETIVKEALEAKRNGYRVGIRSIVENFRWNHRKRTMGDDYKINNNVTSRYARMAMELVPELDGFFDTREMEGD